MKMMIATLGVLTLLGVTSVRAEETLSEKATVTGKSVKRSAKKGVNRTKEAICGKLTGDSKVECMAKEAGNRIEESSDVVKDKASEIKNNVDSN
ncbi:MAG: hypothetical protein J0L82_19535 [Deltaproteobacteria bacterium]|jgi:hypothetical protein|nr:hypothetical protein [Deltaproteobacteria bacterium]